MLSMRFVSMVWWTTARYEISANDRKKGLILNYFPKIFLSQKIVEKIIGK